MKNKSTIVIPTLLIAFYGLIGFWINIGNETINPILFISIMSAIIIAPIAIVFSSYISTKGTETKTIVKAGAICFAVALIAFVGFIFLLLSGEIEKMPAIISGVILASSPVSLLYAISFIVIALVKREKS